MKNYQKISLLLLLSTAVTVNAFNPYDTSGKPDFGDFDDASGGPIPTSRSRDYGKTELEREAEIRQKSTPAKKPVPQPIPVPQPQKNPNPFLEKQKHQEAEKRQREEAANKEKVANILANEFLDICREIEKRNTVLQEEIDAENSYNNDINEITEKRSLGRCEKFFIGVAVVTGAAAIITDTAENAPKYVVVAIGSTIGTAYSYFSRGRRCNREEQIVNATHQTKLEKAAATTRTAVRTKEQLIADAETRLAHLKTVAPSEAHDAIAEFEARLNNLKA